MKKQVSPFVILAALAVIIAVIGYFGVKAMSPEPVQGMDRAEFKKRMQQYQNSTSMKGGGGGPAGAPGGAPAPGGSVMGGYPGGKDGKPVPPSNP